MNTKIVIVLALMFSFQCAWAERGGKGKPPSETELRLQALEDRVFELESFHPPAPPVSTYTFIDTYTGGVIDTQTGHVSALREFFSTHLGDDNKYLYIKFDTSDLGLITEQCYPIENNYLASIAHLITHSEVTLSITPETDSAYYQANNTGWVSYNTINIVSRNEIRDGDRVEVIVFRYTFGGVETILYDVDNEIFSIRTDSVHQGLRPTYTEVDGEVAPETLVTYTIGTDRLQTCGF